MTSYTCAVRYWLRGHCAAPLHTGNEDADSERVLRRWDGRPLLPGSSLAGALRARLAPDQAEAFFGSTEQEGSLLLSDLVFDAGTRMVLRPRVQMNPRYGTTAHGARFDMAHLETGSAFTGALVWRGRPEERQAATRVLESLLADLDGGIIRLGAQKSNGFGRVRLDTVRTRVYELTRPVDRQAWLADGDDPVPAAARTVRLPAASADGITFAVHARMEDFLVKANAGTGVGSQGINAVNLREAGRAVLPGSSLKGTMRAHLESLIPLCPAIAEPCRDLFGWHTARETMGAAGQLRVSDGVLRADGTACTVTRIRIDRFTGGVQRGALFQEQPCSGWCDFTITLPTARDAFGALVAVALRDLGLGLYALGSGAALGRGRVARLEVAVQTAYGRQAAFVCENGRMELQDPAGLLENWMKTLGGVQG